MQASAPARFALGPGALALARAGARARALVYEPCTSQAYALVSARVTALSDAVIADAYSAESATARRALMKALRAYAVAEGYTTVRQMAAPVAVPAESELLRMRTDIFEMRQLLVYAASLDCMPACYVIAHRIVNASLAWYCTWTSVGEWNPRTYRVNQLNACQFANMAIDIHRIERAMHPTYAMYLALILCDALSGPNGTDDSLLSSLRDAEIRIVTKKRQPTDEAWNIALIRVAVVASVNDPRSNPRTRARLRILLERQADDESLATLEVLRNRPCAYELAYTPHAGTLVPLEWDPDYEVGTSITSFASPTDDGSVSMLQTRLEIDVRLFGDGYDVRGEQPINSSLSMLLRCTTSNHYSDDISEIERAFDFLASPGFAARIAPRGYNFTSARWIKDMLDLAAGMDKDSAFAATDPSTTNVMRMLRLLLSPLLMPLGPGTLLCDTNWLGTSMREGVIGAAETHRFSAYTSLRPATTHLNAAMALLASHAETQWVATTWLLPPSVAARLRAALVASAVPEIAAMIVAVDMPGEMLPRDTARAETQPGYAAARAQLVAASSVRVHARLAHHARVMQLLDTPPGRVAWLRVHDHIDEAREKWNARAAELYTIEQQRLVLRRLVPGHQRTLRSLAYAAQRISTRSARPCTWIDAQLLLALAMRSAYPGHLTLDGNVRASIFQLHAPHQREAAPEAGFRGVATMHGFEHATCTATTDIHPHYEASAQTLFYRYSASIDDEIQAACAPLYSYMMSDASEAATLRRRAQSESAWRLQRDALVALIETVAVDVERVAVHHIARLRATCDHERFDGPFQIYAHLILNECELMAMGASHEAHLAAQRVQQRMHAYAQPVAFAARQRDVARAVQEARDAPPPRVRRTRVVDADVVAQMTARADFHAGERRTALGKRTGEYA